MIATRIWATLCLSLVIAFTVLSAEELFARPAKVWIASRKQQLKSSTHNAMIFAAAGSSTRDGVYTTDQAQQGKALYDKQCATCHGATLQGVGQVVPLAGDDFLANWAGKTLADIYTITQTTMPTSQPGLLKPDETAQILAYILSVNTFPAGKTELPKDLDSLKAIHMDKPQPKS